MDYSDILKGCGLKVTKGRVEILKVLFNNKDISAEFILSSCKKNGVDINQSTVYRAVELFEEKGIIEKYPLKDGIFVYRTKGEEHKHIVKCSVCNKQTEIPCPMKQLESIVKDETGFTLTEHNLVMEGVCKECSKDIKK